ncbi:MAG TPA: peptidoglycan DD-metalloendopeptidase family protein [Dongiaceae bacterium]|nr:peptidoglycan DD-metalloendopeptidase family protein [Dongiaceae bacterium]
MPPRELPLAAFAVCIAATLAMGAQAADQQSPAPSLQELEAIQQQLDQGKIEAGELNRKAEQLAKDVARLQRQLIESAAAVQDAEEQANDLENDLEELTAREAARSAELAQKRGQLSRTLMALERLSLRPSQAAFFSDRPAVDEARAARLLTAATQALDARARQLQSDLAEIQELHEATTAKQEELAASVRNLAKQNRQLGALLEAKSKLRDATQQQNAEQRRRQEELASQARDLKDLLDRLAAAAAAEAERQRQAEAAAAAAAAEAAEDESEAAETDEEAGSVQTAARPPQPDLAVALSTPPPVDLRSFPSADASLTRPARGDIVAKFGERTEAFGEGKGLVFSTRPGAQIVSPFDGQIVFEGPFRSYGQILIIEHRGGYHTVLAGLSHVAVAVGQWLKAGEPVGAMAEAPGTHPQLYVELRRGGVPFDPAPWLAP